MSESNVPPRTSSGVRPYGTGETTQQDTSGATGAASTSGGASGTGGAVKERVAGTASQAGDAGKDVAHDAGERAGEVVSEAKDRAGEVAHEATERARNLFDDTRSELRSQAQTQQERLAEGLRSLSDEFNQMARTSDDPGYASELVGRAGGMTDRVASWFEERDPDAVLRDVQRFARRRPGAFLAIAAGAGLLVGRMARGAKDASGDGGASGSGTSSPTSGTSGDYPRPTGATTGTGTTAGGAGAVGSGAYTGTDPGPFAPPGSPGTPATASGTGATTGSVPPSSADSGARRDVPDVGTSGAYPALANDRLDDDSSTSPRHGAGPATSGGADDVYRT